MNCNVSGTCSSFRINSQGVRRMTVQYIFGVDLGLSVATHKPRSPREVTRLAGFSAQTPRWPVKDPEGWRGQNLIIFHTSISP